MQLLTSKEAAEYLRIPESTLRVWRCAGSGPAYFKVRGRVRYDVADLEAFVSQGRREPSVRVAMEAVRVS